LIERVKLEQLGQALQARADVLGGFGQQARGQLGRGSRGEQFVDVGLGDVEAPKGIARALG
jgi:hypothetical protein